MHPIDIYRFPAEGCIGIVLAKVPSIGLAIPQCAKVDTTNEDPRYRNREPGEACKEFQEGPFLLPCYLLGAAWASSSWSLPRRHVRVHLLVLVWRWWQLHIHIDLLLDFP